MERSIVIYSDVYLTISMTFIYRQLMHNGSIPKIVCAKEVSNLEVFPYDKVFYPKQDDSSISKAIKKIRKKLKGEYVYFDKYEDNYWMKSMRENNSGLIHAHFGTGGIRMLDVKKSLGIPLITTFHGYDLSYLLSDSGYVRQLNTLFKEGDLFISVSEYFNNKLQALGCPKEKIVTHYIGIPVEKYKFRKREIKGDKIRIVQVSNFIKKKGHVYLLEGFKKLVSEMDNIELVLVGDGPERKEIENKIISLNLEDRVKLLGELKSDLALCEMDKSDIFVHHSITPPDRNTEGIPTVIMEAMSLGLPVVSTHHTGIPELIKNGENGLLTEERDTNGISSAIIELIKNKDLYAAISERGRATVEKDFNIDIQNKRLDEIYKSVMK